MKRCRQLAPCLPIKDKKAHVVAVAILTNDKDVNTDGKHLRVRHGGKALHIIRSMITD
jgi:hypothetical protein